jgi:hypothetical protein
MLLCNTAYLIKHTGLADSTAEIALLDESIQSGVSALGSRHCERPHVQRVQSTRAVLYARRALRSY